MCEKYNNNLVQQEIKIQMIEDHLHFLLHQGQGHIHLVEEEEEV